MDWEWVIGIYEGDKAQSVLAHAHHGIGYFIRRSEGSGKGLWVEAASRRPIDSPTQDHLVVVDPVVAMRLDKLYRERHQYLFQKEGVGKKATDEAVEKARNIFYGTYTMSARRGF